MSDNIEKTQATDDYISLSLSDLETPIFKSKYAEAEVVLQKLMQNQRKGVMTFNLRPAGRKLSNSQSLTESYQIIEKLATLLTKMFCDESYVPSEAMFNEFVLGKKFLAYLFSASSYQNTDHIIKHLGLDQKGNFTKNDIRRFLMLYLPESTFDLPWVKLAHFMPTEVSKAYLGLLSSVVLLMSETSSTQLNKLSTLAKEMPLINFSRPANLEMMAAGYFHVSNLSGKEKYHFKQWAVKNYTRFMEGYLKSSTIDQLKKVKQTPNLTKPTIVIIHEHYRDNHAMYRCYHSLISALKNKFNVVGIASKGSVDKVGQADHHSFTEYENIYELETIIADILSIKPDMVYYPSIGMSNHVPMLATQRLAPLQCMSPGHPSSSMIDTIDYMLYLDIGVEKSVIQTFWSEKVDFISGKLNGMTVSDFTLEPVKQDSDTIKIAVNGVVPKVTNELISTCQKITAGTNKQLEFQFFIGSPRQDLEYYAAISHLRRTLPNAKVHLYQNYNAYINVLAQCSFAIPTFPFGGSNSNIDCLRICIPKLFVIDDSSYVGYTDYQIWKTIDMLDGYCESIDTLISRSIEFIENPDRLTEFKAKMKSFDLQAFDESATNENIVDNRLSDKFFELLENIKPSS